MNARDYNRMLPRIASATGAIVQNAKSMRKLPEKFQKLPTILREFAKWSETNAANFINQTAMQRHAGTIAVGAVGETARRKSTVGKSVKRRSTGGGRSRASRGRRKPGSGETSAAATSSAAG